jgi:excisionase family DNA binding protein
MHHPSMPRDTTRRSFSIDEIASRNYMSRSSVYKEISEGRLRSFKVGRARRVSAEAERDWIAEREAESG